MLVEDREIHRALPITVCCTLSVLTLQALGAPSAMPAAFQTQQAQDASSSARVRVKLDGFDLSHSGRSPNQVGMGGRERPESPSGSVVPAPPAVSRRSPPAAPARIGGTSQRVLILYAPPSAKAYTLTPTFYWQALDPQSTYTFTLSSNAAPHRVLYFEKVSGTHFTYPPGAPPLASGQSYTWSVVTQDSLAASGAVTIVGGAERAALDQKLRDAGGPGSQGEAQILFDARIWFDALDDYTRLIEHTPSGNFYRQRSALYDQLPTTYALADSDLARAGK